MTVQSEKYQHEKTMNTHWSESRKGKSREKEVAQILVHEEGTMNRSQRSTKYCQVLEGRFGYTTGANWKFKIP